TPSPEEAEESQGTPFSQWPLSPAPSARSMMSDVQEHPEDHIMQAPDQDDLGHMTDFPTTPNNFRFGAKNYFLTWSQIGDLDNEYIQNKFDSLGANVKTWFAAEEHHQDGGRHWHAFIMFHQKLRTRDKHYFDVGGIHPNIKVSKGNSLDQVKIWKYLNKDHYHKFGPWEGPNSTQDVGGMKEAYAAAASAHTRDEFFQLIKHADPKNYITQFERLEYYADKHFAPPKKEYTPPEQDFIRIPDEMKMWVEHELPKNNRPKSLVIWGPSRTGKTSWARSLGHHSYMSTMWNIDEIDETAQYLVLDDINFDTFPTWQAFLGAQSEFTVSDKYKRKKTLKNWNKPCIWLSNKNILDSANEQWKKEWLEANCIIVYLEHRLFWPPD
ncbi:hypothetical protein BC826DRAFT_882638, partial [Russula brevipes]